MKNVAWLVLSSLFVSNIVWGAEAGSWSAQSTETQFEKTSAEVFTTSQQGQANMSPMAQSTTARSVKSKPQTYAKMLTARPSEQSVNHEFWVFDAWVSFQGDEDRDGYFNHFSVEFDVDTDYHTARVYAVLYLGVDEVFKEYHTTSNFSVFSDHSNDSFVVESKLVTGFSPDDYEVLIEVYDADNDELVAVYDGNDDADLYLLPLESADYAQSQVVVVREHGGSLGFWGVILLLPMVLGRYLYQSILTIDHSARFKST
ncbi:choice-of-anchor H family protein [uncultured Paraglaciecola sp.]|uniref:choice-of-anchor H family protein n=1 Tax=uncultured Paraglaciecola sp. TaxID=1765024 RepID=UPI00261666A6|nr:choice-of-anchor H family protein [uncultured Paraglaciecola sp.]